MVYLLGAAVRLRRGGWHGASEGDGRAHHVPSGKWATLECGVAQSRNDH